MKYVAMISSALMLLSASAFAQDDVAAAEAPEAIPAEAPPEAAQPEAPEEEKESHRTMPISSGNFRSGRQPTRRRPGGHNGASLSARALVEVSSWAGITARRTTAPTNF